MLPEKRIIFMGSADFSVRSLEMIAAKYNVCAVFTRTDKPRGRALRMASSPVAETSRALGLRVFPTEDVNLPDNMGIIRDIGPDIVIVVAFGRILKAGLLKMPRLGCINLHASLLPRHRGAAPIQAAIAEGDAITGVTTLYMSEKLDAGDVIFRRETGIMPDDTGGSLAARLSDMGGELLLETIDAVFAGVAPRNAQDPSLVTYAGKLSRDDGRIDWSMPAASICRRIRAFNPWPSCFSDLCCNDRRLRLKILSGSVEECPPEDASLAPGTIICAGKSGVMIKTGAACVSLGDVQPEGRRAMPASAFAAGYRVCVGDTCL